MLVLLYLKVKNVICVWRRKNTVRSESGCLLRSCCLHTIAIAIPERHSACSAMVLNCSANLIHNLCDDLNQACGTSPTLSRPTFARIKLPIREPERHIRRCPGCRPRPGGDDISLRRPLLRLYPMQRLDTQEDVQERARRSDGNCAWDDDAYKC